MARYDVREDPEGDGWYVWDNESDDMHHRFDDDAEEAAFDLARTLNAALINPREGGPLREQLESQREAFAAAAQRVYDEWEQDEDGLDEDLGAGGICDQISAAIAAVVECDTVEGGQDGDDHAWLIATDWVAEAYQVDIHPSWYEEGGGYTWRKTPSVKFTGEMITIAPLDVTLIAQQRTEY